MLHVTDRHFDYLRLLDSASALFQVFRRYEPAEISQAVIHAISPALLDDPVRHRILLQQKRTYHDESDASLY